MDEDDENGTEIGNNNNETFAVDQYNDASQSPLDVPRQSTADSTCWTSIVSRLRLCCCSNSSHNHYENPEHRKSYGVLRIFAIAFSRRPLIVLLFTLTIAFSITWIGLSEYGLPEFDDPYLGFETRSTPIANRIITLRNLKNEVSQLQSLENYPGEKLAGREWRRKRRDITPGENEEKDETFELNSRDFCGRSPIVAYSRIALELKDPKNPFDFETVMLMCFFQKKVEELHSYESLCEKDAAYECCPAWSLPNYIASYRNLSDCAQLQVHDIKAFAQDLLICHNFYKNETSQRSTMVVGADFVTDCRTGSICPQMCTHGGILHEAYTLTLDNSFMIKNESRFTMIELPLGKNSNDEQLMGYLQDEIPNIVLPRDYVSLAGYDFGGKDSTFKTYLVSDLQYMVVASVIIFFIVCLYTKSIFVTIISFVVLTLSMGNAYFIYSAILKVPYFPFMNMLVTIIVMGIGTDGTLILGSQWHRLQIKHASQRGEKPYWETMMIDLLSETTAPLFITTCTTAAAFFASLTSSITTIRCFSIFAGTATLIGFILLYFSVPPALILSDLAVDYLRSLLPHESESKGKIYTKVLQLYHRLKDVQRASTNVFIKPYRCIQTLVENNRAKCWLASFLILIAILMWSIFVVFIHPTFELPDTEQFQLLSSNHPIEKFDRVVEPQFTFAGLPEEELADKLTVYFVWGVQSADSGNTLDPMDNGVLQFDNSFSLDLPTNQKWMRKLCTKLKQQPFYDEVANSRMGAHYDSCFIETMIKWMKRDCEHIFFKNVSYTPCCKVSKFPYDADVFEKCVGLASRDMHRTPSIYFRSDVAGPKFFVLTENANQQNNKKHSPRLVNISANNPSLPPKTIGGNLAVFSLRIHTNMTFSLSYEKMNKFYNQVETFFNEHLQLEKVPVGLENGFFISAHFDFYDLQKSLINDTVQSVLLSAVLCFLLLWIFVKKLRVAIGAVICIFSIVIVSSAILITAFSWKLGVFESIAVTVAVGLSDFTAHNSIEFSKRKSVAAMTSPTFFAAVTTITMGLMMFLCSNVLVYQQIGAFFFILILVSWTYSVFFLSPVLALFDFIWTALRLRRVPKPPSAIFTTSASQSSFTANQINNETQINDNIPVEGIVFSNSNAILTSRVNRRSKSLRKNRAISEPTIHNARNSVHFGRAESTELVESPIRRGIGTRSSHNMMEQWKLLKKLGTETAV